MIYLLLAALAAATCGDPTGTARFRRPLDARMLVTTLDGHRSTVGLMNADGSGFEPVLVECVAYAAPVALAWAPSYERFALARATTDGSTIWSINADGTDRRTILDFPSGVVDGISWPPDGREILFGACYFGSSGPCGIFTVPEAGGEIDTLLTSWRNPVNPRWSPDGRSVAFVQDADGGMGLYVMNADGSGIRELLVTASELGSPAWSPDGERIAFVSDQAGSDDIWVVGVDGLDAHRLTHAADFYDSTPAWAPDGESIAFARSFYPDPSYVMIVSDTGGEPRRLEWPEYVTALTW
jgi:Tol biopolymer transport system component